MINISKLNSRLKSLLLFLLATLLLSCNTNKEKQVKEGLSNATSQETAIDSRNDSLSIDVKFSSEAATSFNIADKYLYNSNLEFINPSGSDTIISKKISTNNEAQLIKFLGFSIINGKTKKYRHYFFVPNNISNVNFIFNKEGDVELEKSKGVIILDELYSNYKNLKIKNTSTSRAQKKIILKDTYLSLKSDSLFQNKSLIQLNDYLYLERLQRINPFDPEIEDYLTSTDFLIKATPLDHLLFFYVKNRIETFDYSKMNTMNYSSDYLHLVSVGLFNFLRSEDKKGDKGNSDAQNWLKTTSFYKANSFYIEKEITPLDNEKFKQQLSNLELLNTSMEDVSLLNILKENPSDYYLIDFWATWCAPCIKGIKIMDKMKIPRNISIISLSTDYKKDEVKWKNRTKKLGQDISFLIKSKVSKNKEFLNFIELKSIPRYILMDKNLNLIDEAFLHPNEPNFLPKLQDLKNHKYW